jgi:hypothetical protein
VDSKPIFFCHIPKTGGHAVKKAAKMVLGTQFVFSADDLAALRKAYDSGNLSAKKLIIGHLLAREVLTVFRRSEIHLATFIRNPAERLISEYYQIQSHQTRWLSAHAEEVLRKIKKQSLRDYVRSRDPDVQRVRNNGISKFFLSFDEDSPAVDNKQLLAATDQFDFIGFTEDFDNSLRSLFSRVFPECADGFDTDSIGFVNTRYEKADFDAKVFDLVPKLSEPIDATICEKIRADVALDVRLYNMVAERLGRSDLSCNGLPSCSSALILDTSPEFSQRVARNLERQLQLAEQALVAARSQLPVMPARSRLAPEGYLTLLWGAWKIIRSERKQGISLRTIILPRLRQRLG